MRLDDRTQRSMAVSSAVIEVMAAQIEYEAGMRCLNDVERGLLEQAHRRLRLASESLFHRSRGIRT